MALSEGTKLARSPFVSVMAGCNSHRRPKLTVRWLVDLPFVLAVNTPVPGIGVDLWAPDVREVRLRRPEQKVAEGIARQRAGEVELAVVVRSVKIHEGVIKDSARVEAESHRVIVFYDREIVRELVGLRKGLAHPVLPDACNAAV